MKTIVVIQLILVLVFGGSWIFNMVQFVGCDFEAPYKCEAVHGAGLIPSLSLVTVWVDTGN